MRKTEHRERNRLLRWKIREGRIKRESELQMLRDKNRETRKIKEEWDMCGVIDTEREGVKREAGALVRRGTGWCMWAWPTCGAACAGPRSPPQGVQTLPQRSLRCAAIWRSPQPACGY